MMNLGEKWTPTIDRSACKDNEGCPRREEEKEGKGSER
jgi:hypothetical protein